MAREIKAAHAPLWDRTLNTIKPFIAGRRDTEKVFLNRYGNPMTKFGIYELLERNVIKATAAAPTLAKKK
jgi:putative integrase/recombinase